MSGISKNTLQFLKDLAKNNNREWFAKNKGRYEEAKAEFEIFVTDLLKQIAKFDSKAANLDAKKCIFRIYRDTRFSKDKSPYKPNFGAYLADKATQVHDSAAYYIHIEPGKSFLAGGAYEPQAPWINKIRQEIDYNTKDFKKIINAASFKKNFGELSGEKLKTVPKGYAKDHPELSLLQYKSFLMMHQCDDKTVMAEDFTKYATGIYKTMKPLNDFLNMAAE
ncbi:MAG: DUF2461 domain-containing protein [Bacteroidetes bacterium]|nr:DUF2461 domain-containing protein [Bacteroidota bacterium]